MTISAITRTSCTTNIHHTGAWFNLPSDKSFGRSAAAGLASPGDGSINMCPICLIPSRTNLLSGENLSPAASHVVYSTHGAGSAMKRPATRVADLLNPAALLLPAANVIMQLSLPGVGYGVLESPVDSGNVYKHPFKRARTTGTYLAVATIGTDADRELIRTAVDTAHKQVRSTPSSPVSYNAFDPALQLWVAACLYRYFVDQHEFLYGRLDESTAAAVYQDAKRLGTTLQVRA